MACEPQQETVSVWMSLPHSAQRTLHADVHLIFRESSVLRSVTSESQTSRIQQRQVRNRSSQTIQSTHKPHTVCDRKIVKVPGDLDQIMKQQVESSEDKLTAEKGWLVERNRQRVIQKPGALDPGGKGQ